jgi:hypothetical protein
MTPLLSPTTDMVKQAAEPASATRRHRTPVRDQPRPQAEGRSSSCYFVYYEAGSASPPFAGLFVLLPGGMSQVRPASQVRPTASRTHPQPTCVPRPSPYREGGTRDAVAYRGPGQGGTHFPGLDGLSAWKLNLWHWAGRFDL